MKYHTLMRAGQDPRCPGVGDKECFLAVCLPMAFVVTSTSGNQSPLNSAPFTVRRSNANARVGRVRRAFCGALLESHQIGRKSHIPQLPPNFVAINGVHDDHAVGPVLG